MATTKRSRAARKAARTRLATQPRAVRVRAGKRALAGEPTTTVSHAALSRHTREVAAERSPRERSAAARRAVRTKGPRERSLAARKAARTRAA